MSGGPYAEHENSFIFTGAAPKVEIADAPPNENIRAFSCDDLQDPRLRLQISQAQAVIAAWGKDEKETNPAVVMARHKATLVRVYGEEFVRKLLNSYVSKQSTVTVAALLAATGGKPDVFVAACGEHEEYDKKTNLCPCVITVLNSTSIAGAQAFLVMPPFDHDGKNVFPIFIKITLKPNEGDTKTIGYVGCSCGKPPNVQEPTCFRVSVQPDRLMFVHCTEDRADIWGGLAKYHKRLEEAIAEIREDLSDIL